jgi:glycopeptide antibiotics resistance protein
LHVTFLGPLGLLVVAVGALGVTIGERSRDRTAGSRLLLVIALCASLAAIVAVTLVPGRGSNDLQLVPLIQILRDLGNPVDSGVLANVVGNLGLFLPLGAALCLLGLRRRTTLLTALLLSAPIEIAQLFVPGRTTSVDDVLLNALGALLGHVLVSPWAPVASSPSPDRPGRPATPSFDAPE